ncbi:MAG: sugar phosphate isomerase/epimerase family protein [Bryobacteraceae bacterium]
MKRALSTYLLVNHRLTTVWLDRIWNAEIPLVEFFCARQHFDYHNRAQITELSYWFRDSPLKIHSLHAPLYNDDCWGRTGPEAVVDITEPVKAKRIKAVDDIKRALEVAETIPFQYLVQHMGNSGAEFSERAMDSAFASLEELNVFARQRGVEVLLENIPNSISSAERLLMFLEATHLDLSFCFDTGHAHLHEGIDTAYRLMKTRIRSTHVHDNNGVDDNHIFPIVGGGGMIDWRRAMQTLRSEADQYPLLLELREIEDVENPLDHVRRVFEALESQRPIEAED